jgi:hypothetical protein
MGFSTHQLSGGSLERLNEKDRNERQRASHEDRRFSPGSKDDQPEGEKDQRGKKRKRKKGRKKWAWVKIGALLQTKKRI